MTAAFSVKALKKEKCEIYPLVAFRATFVAIFILRGSEMTSVARNRRESSTFPLMMRTALKLKKKVDFLNDNNVHMVCI